MRVVSYNVLAPRYADGYARYACIADGLRELHADVIALQELPVHRARELVGDGYALAAHPATDAEGIGACLASRWPLGEVHTLDLSTAAFAWAGAVLAEVRTPHGVVMVAHHKPNWAFGMEHERESQAVATVDLVERHAPDPRTPVVLLGDFDATPDSASVRFLTGKQSLAGHGTAYQDAWSAVHRTGGLTFTPENPLVRNGDMPLETGRRIDYVLVRCGPHGPALEVTACTRVFDEPRDGLWCSDHFGVAADLVAPSRPVGSTDTLVSGAPHER